MSPKNNPILSSHRDAATRVSTYLGEQGIKLSPINALEVVARVLGAANWQTLKAAADQGKAPRMAEVASAEVTLPAVGEVVLSDSPSVQPVPVAQRWSARSGLRPFARIKDMAGDAAGTPREVESFYEASLEASELRPFARIKDMAGDAAGTPREVERVYKTSLEAIAKSLRARWSAPALAEIMGFDANLEQVQQAMGLVLTPMQCEALRTAFKYRLCSITGDAGTGRATTLRALVPLAHKMGLTRVYQARAHYLPAGANLEQLQRCDVLILEEHVLRNPTLMQFLLEQAPADCRVVMFGEIPALAAIALTGGYADFTTHGRVPAIRLTEKFRQLPATPADGPEIVRITRLSPPSDFS